MLPPEELEHAPREIVEKIAPISAQGNRAGKEAFSRQIEMPLEEAFRFAEGEMLKAMTSRDSDEGISAFLEKREPQWGKA